MKISVVPPEPIKQTFMLELSEDELRVVEHALNKDGNHIHSNGATNYDVWDKLDDFLEENDIVRLTDL